ERTAGPGGRRAKPVSALRLPNVTVGDAARHSSMASSARRSSNPMATAPDRIPVSDEGTALDGTLAASLERTARLAATVLQAPAAFVALVGSDRRCFGGGTDLPAWFFHDPGVLIRSGLGLRIAEAEGVVSVTDARGR